jgi:GDP-4-dehydro-6-deoxy-D-mannose reductase
VRDVVEAYLDLVERGRAGEAYNVCTGRALKLRDLLETMKAMARVPLGVESDPERVRAVDIPYLVGERKKISSDLGWAPKRALTETVGALLEGWRARLGVGRGASATEGAARERTAHAAPGTEGRS